MSQASPSPGVVRHDALATMHKTLVILWFIWAGLLSAAMVLGNVEGASAAATTTRMGSSVALAVIAWFAWSYWRHAPVGRYALAIAVGMTLGAIGDFFNADLLPFIPIRPPVLGGIAAFGLGHIAYIAGCISMGRRGGLFERGKMIAAIAVWQLVGLVSWYLIVMQGEKNRELVWPALGYTLLLAGTAGITSGLALAERRLLPLALGGALFLASDLILAIGMFRGSFPYRSECVWLTYGPGQMLIVFSTISAAVVLSAKRAAAPGSP